MSTEQQQQQPAHSPHNEPKYEPSTLGLWLSNTWTKFKEGRLLSYPMMAALLLVATAVGFGLWFYFEHDKTQSARWVEWDGLATTSELNKFAEEAANQNTIQAKLARMEVARRQLGEEGIDRLTSPDPQVRKDAAASIEKAREAFGKLVDEFEGYPVLKVECMRGCAMSEAALVGMPKEGQIEQFRGDPAKAIEWLRKVADAAPDTPWGKSAKSLADTLDNQNTKQQVVTLQASVYTVPTLPEIGGPKSPTPGFPVP